MLLVFLFFFLGISKTHFLPRRPYTAVVTSHGVAQLGGGKGHNNKREFFFTIDTTGGDHELFTWCRPFIFHLRTRIIGWIKVTVSVSL